jgi:hypothetical protein
VSASYGLTNGEQYRFSLPGSGLSEPPRESQRKAGTSREGSPSRFWGRRSPAFRALVPLKRALRQKG